MASVWPGKHWPLGATWDGDGVNFAVFSSGAERVELCLYTSDSYVETHRIRLREETAKIWHCYIPGIKPGQLYGYRVSGPWEPGSGQRFNPNKLLLDPYARAIGRDLAWDDALFPYVIGKDDMVFSGSDSARFAPLAVVVGTEFDWGEDVPLRTPWHKTLIYELHVKGFTKLHPGLPEKLRGTYAGLASPPVIEHLKGLGITAVELMPVHHRVDDRHLLDRGLCNYWGYNTLAYFAPDRRYASDPENAVGEFRRMVKALHSAGIEVILDVVYNHTAEGNQMGPMLSFKGLDNAAYYRLLKDQPRYYEDFTGCGNTLNAREPRVLQLIMDSLRYWITDMHVDGFRFDLASALARELFHVDQLSAFFDIISQDPVISQAKLIAEPWDLGDGGYQVGNFPIGWGEWNGKYRDAVRRLWRGDPNTMSELATRLSGSSDLYGLGGRSPHASINFITCHDGFTLEDLVSYEKKRNEANGEENRDGTEENLSFNCGAEGPTDDPAIKELRARQKRNLMSTLLLSQGVPMILAGDEMGRTQRGNNNAYCQDNELSWQDWDLKPEDKDFLRFTREMIQLRRNQPVLQRRHFFLGRRLRGSNVKDIAWFTPEGREMTDEDWTGPDKCGLAVRLAGDAMDQVDERGDPVLGDTLLILLNAHPEPADFVLPEAGESRDWRLLLETGKARRTDKSGKSLRMEGRSMGVLRLEKIKQIPPLVPSEAGPKAIVGFP